MSLTSGITSVLALLATGLLSPLDLRKEPLQRAPHEADVDAPRFHHIHLMPGDPDQFADYYSRLSRATLPWHRKA